MNGNGSALDLELSSGSSRASKSRSRGPLAGQAILFVSAMLAIPGIAAASAFPIALPDPTGMPLTFSGGTFTIGDCMGANSNDCRLGGSPSGPVGISWDVTSIIPSAPYAFTLNPGGTISAPTGTTVDFTVDDLLGDYITGDLAWTTWSKSGANTFLDAVITPVEFAVTSIPGKAELGTSPASNYYLQIEANCGPTGCVTIADPKASVPGVELAIAPFGLVATPEPRLVLLLSFALAGLALIRQVRSKRIRT